MHRETARFELNLQSRDQPTDVCVAAAKYRANAVVISDAALIPPMLQTRMSTRGSYKVILAVDFPAGTNVGFSNKFKHSGQAAFGCDGFDILLSSRTDAEATNEVRNLIDQLRSINSMYDIRLVIDAFSRDLGRVKSALKAIKSCPPNMIRLDHNLSLPQDITESVVDDTINMVREYTGVPIKFGTNLTPELLTKYYGTITNFDVTLATSNKIVQALDERDRMPKV